MKNYIVYSASGQITKTGTCSDFDFALQGENVIEGVANDSTQYIENDQVCDMPPRPGDCYDFNYNTKQWVPNAVAAEETARQQRNSFLARTDWTQLADIPVETKNLWEPYRQALRDITSQEGYPFNVIWPTKPE